MNTRRQDIAYRMLTTGLLLLCSAAMAGLILVKLAQGLHP